MNHDPEIFPDFDNFRPERFLDESGKIDIAPPDTHGMGHVTFGFGRRMCPGRHMGVDTVWLTVAAALACLEIGKARDERGREIEVREEFKSGFVV